MTLPDERYRAVVQTERFLKELLSTPRVPRAVKDSARSLLRHYPSTWDMARAAASAPAVFQERMEPVTRLFAQWEESRQDGDSAVLPAVPQELGCPAEQDVQSNPPDSPADNTV